MFLTTFSNNNDAFWILPDSIETWDDKIANGTLCGFLVEYLNSFLAVWELVFNSSLRSSLIDADANADGKTEPGKLDSCDLALDLISFPDKKPKSSSFLCNIWSCGKVNLGLVNDNEFGNSNSR